MTAAAISTAGLTRRFGARVAVQCLSLEVGPGRVTAFLGPNGAGKTTTLRMILGLLRPDAGAVHLFGNRVAGARETVLGRVGALVESPVLYDHLSGRDNLELTRRLLGLPRPRTDRALEIVGLAADAGRRVAGYSLGMRQRLGLALAMIGEPELLILDEPANGLDPAGIREMRELIRRLPTDHGTTVFLSSHLLSEVEQVASRVAVIDRGRLRFEGTLEALHRQRRPRLVVGVDRPREASGRLAAQGWTVTLHGDGRLRVEGSGSETAAELCAKLVADGLRVHHLAEERPTLEAAFFELTRTAPGADDEEIS